MTLGIHPSAVESYNRKAVTLVELVKELPPTPVRQNSFPSEIHTAASLSEKDIIGEIEIATSDYRGKTIARFFHINEKRFGLDEEIYKKVIEIAESLQSQPTVRSKLSCSFIEKVLFTWIKNKFKDTGSSESFVEYLDNEAKVKIKSITSWIPIANLEVEIPFSISNSEIRPLSKNVIDKWESKFTSMAGANKEGASKLFKQIREDYQGLAAVVTVIESETEHASKYAMEEAQRITSVLGIFSPATRIPDIKCISRIKGSEYVAQSTIFFEYNNDNFQIRKAIVDQHLIGTWRLSKSAIIQIRRIALDRMSLLLATESLNRFEKAVLNSVLLYSKSAFTADTVEKVVFMLSALESILIKNDNEPIQQNLAERVAVFTAKELNERKLIIKTVKSLYGVRSRYLHHGHTSSELELVADFMRYVQIFFVQLVNNTVKFCSKEEFVAAIDDHKLA